MSSLRNVRSGGTSPPGAAATGLFVKVNVTDAIFHPGMSFWFHRVYARGRSPMENRLRFFIKCAGTIVKTILPSTFGRRHFFDVAPLFAIATQSWSEYGSRAKVRVEQIVDECFPRIWTHPESVFRIVNHFVMDSIASSIEGSIVEVAMRTADPDGDWVLFTVRNWAGGKPEGWTIDPSAQQLAKQIDGYIDVANHPGRSTVYSLYLPTGNLAGWLCRQSQSASGYFISWGHQVSEVQMVKHESSRIEESIQASLLPLGSLVPSGDQAYLFSTSSPLDKATIESAIAESFVSSSSASKGLGIDQVRVDYIGPMGEFMRRLESSIPTSTCDLGWSSISSEPGSIKRVDPPIEAGKISREIPKHQALAATTGGRIRPRRVSAI